MQEPCFLIAEDHPLVSAYLAELIEDQFPAHSKYIANTIEQTVVLIKKTPVDLLILDINLEDGVSLSWIDTIKRLRPKIYVLVLSGLSEDSFGYRSIQMGADGFINKRASPEAIVNAIKTVMDGRKFLSAEIVDNLIKGAEKGAPKTESPFAFLSNREFEIAIMLMEGYSAVDIGRIMNVQRSTVSTHKMSILKKLDVKNVIELNNLGLQYNIKLTLS